MSHDKVLKVSMYIYGVIVLIAGLQLVFTPKQMADWFGLGQLADNALFTSMMLGAIYVVASFFIFAACRDLVKNINWVRFVLFKGFFSIAVFVYSLIQGYINFMPAFGPMVIVEAVILVLILISYPWGKTAEITSS